MRCLVSRSRDRTKLLVAWMRQAGASSLMNFVQPGDRNDKNLLRKSARGTASPAEWTSGRESLNLSRIRSLLTRSRSRSHNGDSV